MTAPTAADVARFRQLREIRERDGCLLPDEESEVNRLGGFLASVHRYDCRLAGASRHAYACDTCHLWPQ